MFGRGALSYVRGTKEEDQGGINLGGYWEAGSLDLAPEKHKGRALRTQRAASA